MTITMVEKLAKAVNLTFLVMKEKFLFKNNIQLLCRINKSNKNKKRTGDIYLKLIFIKSNKYDTHLKFQTRFFD